LSLLMSTNTASVVLQLSTCHLRIVLWSDLDSEMAKNDVDSASVLDSWYATPESWS
jgi:hypothetical protein